MNDGESYPMSQDESENIVHPLLWVRWTDGQSDLHFHEVVRLIPDIEWSSNLPFFNIRPEAEASPTFVDPETGEERQFLFIDGFSRQALRHTPFFIFITFLFLFGSAEISSNVGGLSVFIPPIDAWIFFLIAWMVPYPLFIWLIYRTGILGNKESLVAKSSVIYALPIALAIFTLICILQVFITPNPHTIEPNIVFVSGYLLTFFFGGLIFYEGILRLENLLVNMKDREIIDDSEAYRAFLSDITDSLRTSIYGIRASTLFGVGLAFQFGLLWTFGKGPQNLGYAPNVIANVALNTILGIAAFQFIVLIYYFKELLVVGGAYENILGYEPFHTDKYGGYRELGRFAIRFNLLIGLGGLFLVYRLYINGARALPNEGLAGVEQGAELLFWFMNYVGPIGIYGIIAFAWGYFTFWKMHKKMVREKDMISQVFQGTPQTDGAAGAGVPVESMENGPDWENFKNAPEWPLKPSRLRQLISGNIVTLLIPLPELLIF